MRHVECVYTLADTLEQTLFVQVPGDCIMASDEARNRGNALFGEKKYLEALEAYAEGLTAVRCIPVAIVLTQCRLFSHTCYTRQLV